MRLNINLNDREERDGKAIKDAKTRVKNILIQQNSSYYIIDPTNNETLVNRQVGVHAIIR